MVRNMFTNVYLPRTGVIFFFLIGNPSDIYCTLPTETLRAKKSIASTEIPQSDESSLSATFAFSTYVLPLTSTFHL